MQVLQFLSVFVVSTEFSPIYHCFSCTEIQSQIQYPDLASWMLASEGKSLLWSAWCPAAYCSHPCCQDSYGPEPFLQSCPLAPQFSSCSTAWQSLLLPLLNCKGSLAHSQCLTKTECQPCLKVFQSVLLISCCLQNSWILASRSVLFIYFQQDKPLDWASLLTLRHSTPF